MPKKKIWANFQRIKELFTKKIFKKLLKIWSWDPGSEIRDPEKTYSGSRIPDPGVKKHPIPDPGSGSATLPYGGKTLFINEAIYVPTSFSSYLYPGIFNDVKILYWKRERVEIRINIWRRGMERK